MKENWHDIDFRVPLSGSKLFDLNTTWTAEKLCSKFPGLKWRTVDNSVQIYGQLNDYWYDQFNIAVFQLGTIEG